ncbi:MAG: hypothetical protein ACKVWV_13950 [Planctomycetota bacterium]
MSAAMLLTIATAILLATIAFSVFSLARRLSQLERRVAPWGAKHLLQGPLEGSKLVSQVVVRLLNGDWRSIGGESPRPLLLVFLARGCGPCQALATHLRALERAWRKDVDVLILVKAPPGEAYDELHDLGLHELPASSSPFLFDIWGIRVVPYAVLLDRNGSVDTKGVVNTLEHLEYLVDLDAPARTVSYRITRPGEPAGAPASS